MFIRMESGGNENPHMVEPYRCPVAHYRPQRQELNSISSISTPVHLVWEWKEMWSFWKHAFAHVQNLLQIRASFTEQTNKRSLKCLHTSKTGATEVLQLGSNHHAQGSVCTQFLYLYSTFLPLERFPRSRIKKNLRPMFIFQLQTSQTPSTNSGASLEKLFFPRPNVHIEALPFLHEVVGSQSLIF